MKRIIKIGLISVSVVALLTSSYILYRNQTLEYIVAQTEKAVFHVTTFRDGIPYKSGSGFFINTNELSKEAVFGITNVHVIEGSDSVIITTNNHKTFQVTQVSYYSENCDLFLFRWSLEDIELNRLRSLTLEDNEIEKAQYVFAVSHPHGFEYSFSSGSVASLRESDQYGEIVQSTTPISAGSSGSPLLSRGGRVIGVNTFSYVDGQNLNFAVRLNSVTFNKLISWENRSCDELLFNLAHSLKIGEQIWMDINLNVNHFRNGIIIAEAKTAHEWELACKEGRPVWAYPRLIEHKRSYIADLIKIEDADIVLSKDYGKLYNWYAVADSRSLAPEGWRIPTAYEWSDLIERLGGVRYKTAKKMKSKTGWEYFYQWEDDTNESGFNAFPCGEIELQGTTEGFGQRTGFWTLTEYGKDTYYVVELNNFTLAGVDHNDNFLRDPQIRRGRGHKGEGYSVRCIKEESVLQLIK